MLGAKIGKLFGERLVFQVSVAAHGLAMVLMTISTDAGMMNLAQLIAGIAAAALVPTLVVLIAANYRDRQQSQALGILASVPAIASGVAFVVAGFIATALNWRYSFGLIALLAIAVLALSFRLKPIRARPASGLTSSASCSRRWPFRSFSLASTTSTRGGCYGRRLLRPSRCWGCRPCQS